MGECSRDGGARTVFPGDSQLKRSAALVALLLASCHADETPPKIAVEDAWARATVPGQSGSAAYFTIANEGGADRLLTVSSPVADASLHSTSMNNGVMRMRPLEALDVPAESTVALKPGGTHVMLMALKQPLADGGTLELELKFEKSGEQRVMAEVRPSTANGEGM